MATRQRLIRAAEFLIAHRGLAAVTTRDILELAEQKNQSALHYHFGSIEGLIQASLLDQLRRVDGRRVALMKNTGAHDAHGVLRAIILPHAEDISTREGGCEHMSMMVQYLHTPYNDYHMLTRCERLPGIWSAEERIWQMIPPLRQEMQMIRYRATFSAALAALSSWVGSDEPLNAEEFTEELVGTIVPILCGPVSENEFCWRRAAPSGSDVAPCHANPAQR